MPCRTMQHAPCLHPAYPHAPPPLWHAACRLHEEKCFLSEGNAKGAAEHNGVLTRLVIGCVLTALFMVGEWVAGSIASRCA